MFLIVVADVDAGTEADLAGIRRDNAVYDLQDCGLSCSVISDNGDPLSPPDVKVHTREELLPVKAL